MIASQVKGERVKYAKALKRSRLTGEGRETEGEKNQAVKILL